ncbi:MAG: GTPase HflX [Candidatus Margulisiibacteriota bacterium]
MEKAVLVGIKLKREKISLEESLQELAQLTKTAGARVVAAISQNRETPHQKYFIGEGKLEELKVVCDSKDADLIILDHDVSPSQLGNLEAVLERKVIDRTELILDIFAQHAHTREGKLQVELAQSQFRLSRLSGKGVQLSRLGGGIGTRGPGETKLETDRRHIWKRISLLKKEVDRIKMHRLVSRKKRSRSEIKSIALIGYTNSGKSTLLNALSNARIPSEDKLFATLDPTTRRVYLPSGITVLITDTVGFIQKLPHSLVNAFRATLEETTESDLLIHVVDASSRFYEDQINTVYNVLEELGMIARPIITVFNKLDRVENKKNIELSMRQYAPATAISALQKQGFEELFRLIEKQLSPPS